MAACGIAPEDDDGNSASRRTEIKSTVNENQILDLLAAMDEVTTIKELQEAYKHAYKATNGEQAWQTKVITKKDAKKAALEATLSEQLKGKYWNSAQKNGLQPDAVRSPLAV